MTTHFQIVRRTPYGHIQHRECRDGEWLLQVVPYGRLRALFGMPTFRSAGPFAWDADGLAQDLICAGTGRYDWIGYACMRKQCESVPTAEYRY